MTRRQSFALPLALVLALLVPMSASAQAGSATAFLQRLNQQVDALLARTPSSPSARQTRDDQVAAIVDRLLDYDAFAQATLGAMWAARTPEEQREFRDLLTQNIRRSYLAGLESIRDYDVTYLGEEPAPGGAVVVHTRAQSRTARREPPILVDYVMRRVGGTWRVQDVVTDHASLVANQGSAFRRVIVHDGWADFMTQLRERIAHPAG